ncbi:hypothetical protein TKK_0010338 [Trichogramma kaykai]|uniref:Mitochondrial cytochrome c oxidase subunit VIc/VIIs domain-containing protein n=1 Tax=Trichogramma kaykai TaxID=54128 RepID=A0ABD2WWV5_9HYME
MAGAIPKPQLKRLLEAKIKASLVGAVAVTALSGVLWYSLVMAPRKKAYADFYKTYDAEKQLKIMCDAGLMQSCGPN